MERQRSEEKPQAFNIDSRLRSALILANAMLGAGALAAPPAIKPYTDWLFLMTSQAVLFIALKVGSTK